MSPGKSVGGDDHAAHRTRFEQDYDRILFSTSVRRLSDKTQVFPLDANDGVRTRLTHSHEVANLAKSIGLRASIDAIGIFGSEDVERTVLPILGAIGLAHDLGNPPFGHQGEAAISKWFEDNQQWVFDRKVKGGNDPVEPVENDYRKEFLKFDGNPQSFRILTRLHASQGRVGLDLCAATLMALMKYPFPAAGAISTNLINKKYGYFCSESHVVEWARAQTGLLDGQRHPLAWIMEAADDAAYSVLDVEDAMKKGILSPDDLIAILRTDDSVNTSSAFNNLEEAFSKAILMGRSPAITRDIKIGYARSLLIADLVIHATDEFVKHKNEIFNYSHNDPLMESSALCARLKSVAHRYAFGNSEVLSVEAKGRNAIDKLMSDLWDAIARRKNFEEIESKREDAIPRYIYSLFSPNYLEAASDTNDLTHATCTKIRYRELRLLTDMVSGMTDTFALNMYNKIRELK